MGGSPSASRPLATQTSLARDHLLYTQCLAEQRSMLRHWLTADVEEYVLRPLVQQPFITALFSTARVYVIHLDGRPAHAQLILDKNMLEGDYPHWTSTMAMQSGVIFTYAQDNTWRKLGLNPRRGDFEPLSEPSASLAYGMISDTNANLGAVCLDYQVLEIPNTCLVGLTNYTTGEVFRQLTIPLPQNEPEMSGLVVDDHCPRLLYGTKRSAHDSGCTLRTFEFSTGIHRSVVLPQHADSLRINMVSIAGGLGMLSYGARAGNLYTEYDSRLPEVNCALQIEIDKQCRWGVDASYQRHLISDRNTSVYYIDPWTMQLHVIDRRAAKVEALPDIVPMPAEIELYLRNLTWHD